MSGLREWRAAGGFLLDVPRFLRGRVTAQEARARLERQWTHRETTFADTMRRVIGGHAASPYRRLMAWARIDVGDVTAMLASIGVEATLERLHDAGVYVTIEQFKGRRPILRPGLELPVAASDFDNPLGSRQYATQTGGSNGSPRRTSISLDLLDHESLYHALFYEARGMSGRPAAMWVPAPPGAVGMKNALIRARLGEPVARWFSQTRPGDAPLTHRAFARAIGLMSAVSGEPWPAPEFVPAGDASRVAQWMSAAGTRPAMLITTPSGAVRTSLAAAALHVDISGSLFVVVGEPLTAAKADTIARVGCHSASHYAMVESGLIGLSCGAPEAPDDVHLVGDKVATIQRVRTVGANETPVKALFHTTLAPSSPKVMLNVESGDYGEIVERDCGCGMLPRAFRRHLSGIRSYEKFTGEGMHVLGIDLLQVLERELPDRFGGHPTDYQFIEREEDGLTRVVLVIRPSVGPLDAGDVVGATLALLRGRGIGQHLMAETWANADTLRVLRADPHVTSAGKIQALQREPT